MTEENLDDIPTGDNYDTNERQIIKTGRAQIKRYNQLLDRHDKVTSDIHQIIIEFGRTLQAGRELYYSDKHFGDWVRRNRLDTGSISKTQPERTACMTLARLFDTGVEDYNDDGSCTPARLDLTGCGDTVPTNIMKWARKTQRHLFPHMGPAPAVAQRPRRVMVDADLLQTVLDDRETKLSPTVRAMIERALR